MRHGDARVEHVSRLYNIWRGLFKLSHARKGVAVCSEWRCYEAFRDWALSNGYSNDLKIGRIDRGGDYKPANCHWISHKVLCRNRRTSRRITAFGETLTLAEWSERSGIKRQTITARIRKGWSLQRALETAPRGDSARASEEAVGESRASGAQH